ncbi:MAG: TrkA C-terminal domain-containing protein [Clostridia bacterium]|nr:TrkA C-terminal domain-containing protein [Clostridia bacterium]
MEVVIILFTFVIILFMIIAEIFTVLFRLTGLSEDKARFQTISLLTNCGFSTKESEIIMAVKSRRRLARVAMILGYIFSACLISAIVTLIFNLSQSQQDQFWLPLFVCLGAITFVALLFKIKFIKKAFDNIIFKLGHKLSHKKNQNLIKIIDNYGPNSIAEITLSVIPREFLDKTIEQIKIKQNYGILILAITRGSKTISNVEKEEIFYEDDILTVYGNILSIKEVFEELHTTNAVINKKIN